MPNLIKRTLLIAIAVLCIFAVLSTFVTVIHGSDHECSGENCPVCICNTVRDSLIAILITIAFFAVVIYSNCKIDTKDKAASFFGILVNLKVKLSN